MADELRELVKSSADGSMRQAIQANNGGRSALRVLVVDDEPAICHALALLLGWHGLDVVSVLSAAAAKEALAASNFDVLLIDLRLRDGRGDALFRAAVERDASYRERTVFMTGDISTEAERAIAETNCPYLRKPFDITLAVHAIAAVAGVTYAGSGARVAGRGDEEGARAALAR